MAGRKQSSGRSRLWCGEQIRRVRGVRRRRRRLIAPLNLPDVVQPQIRSIRTLSTSVRVHKPAQKTTVIPSLITKDLISVYSNEPAKTFFIYKKRPFPLRWGSSCASGLQALHNFNQWKDDFIKQQQQLACLLAVANCCLCFSGVVNHACTNNGISCALLFQEIANH